MTDPAPFPWRLETPGKPGSNGDHNLYIVDRDGRKIAAVWGKRGEKEATAALIIGAAQVEFWRMLEELGETA